MNAKQSHYGHPAPSWPVPGMGSVQFKAKQAGDGSMSEDEVAPASPRVVEITPTSDGVFQAGMSLISALMALNCSSITQRSKLLHRKANLETRSSVKPSQNWIVPFPARNILFWSWTALSRPFPCRSILISYDYVTIGGHGRLSKDPSNEGVIRKVANEAEIIFYQTLNGDDPLLHAIPDYIRSFFPRFHGVFDRSAYPHSRLL